MTGWQSMETAPRDGTLVRLRFEGRPDSVGKWSTRYGEWVSSLWLTSLPEPSGWRPLGGAA